MTSFSLDISKFAADCGEKADQVVRMACLQLLRGVVLKTPVDTGRARANWMASVDAPAVGTKDFEGDAGSGIQAPSESAGSVASIGLGQQAVKLATGRVFWLSNNLPYIERLEYGHSKQSPQGMVRLTINEVRASLS